MVLTGGAGGGKGWGLAALPGAKGESRVPGRREGIWGNWGGVSIALPTR